MLKGFKEFMLKGDLISVAVGLIMALATLALVEALIADLITPIVAAIVGEPNFADLAFRINGSEFRYGAFINAAIVFVSVVAAVYFFVVLPYKKYQEMKGVSPKMRVCPECTTEISVAAHRCPACTAAVTPESV